MAAAILIVTAFPVSSEDQSLAPDVLVRNVVTDVLAAIRNTPSGDRESREKALAFAKQKILPHIDFERMTRLAVGRAWRSADARQREALVAQFGTLITRVYSAAIDAYDGHETQVDSLQLSAGDNDVIVRSRFKKTGAQPVEVNYAMWKSAEGWKVYDISVENVSLVITYRSQFGEEIARGGINGLIGSLAEKNRAATAPSPRPSPARGEGVLRPEQQ
ncbi:MAG: ABC transporter substrate-binding protein [Betaproteobacteria bacterium]|nr:ABC transporter substrate-binding protein [Betaproteobacteria bacterium]